MKQSFLKRFVPILAAAVLVVSPLAGPAAAQSAPGAQPVVSARNTATLPPDPDTPPHKIIKSKYPVADPDGDDPFERADWFYGLRQSGNPTVTFTVAAASALRAKAAAEILAAKGQTNLPSTFQPYSGAWSPLGPNPIVQIDRTPDQNSYAVTGRVGALAIRSSAPYTMYLGGAQGGVWVSSTLTSEWTPQTDQLGSLAIGAIALASSNEDIIYVGTGEGALSGDSYFGNGVLKSIDAGQTFTQVSGTAFNQVSISKIVVDPANPNIVYAATLPGVAGDVDVRANNATPYGIWKSIDGGVNWTALITTTNRLNGATDLVIDPLDGTNLYASFWGQGISKTVNSGANWSSIMTGFPITASFSSAPGTRFSLGISHPVTDANPTLYTGFDWIDNADNYHTSTVWKSTDKGAHWNITPDVGKVVEGFCDKTGAGPQCTYDNVIGVDPNNANIVYALGLFDYGTGSGGIFRSTDGGTHWVDIGWGLHPDFHAIAIRKDDPSHIVIGNDGGAWSSVSQGGRPGGSSDPLSAVTWDNLNGSVDPVTGAVTARSGLQIGEFTGIGQNPTVAGRVYGGLQDNGTLRKSGGSVSWFDLASGDGGQVLVDPTDPNFIYGTYPGLIPYRFNDGMTFFLSNAPILNGIDQNDRSAFYIPFQMDPANPNRLYLGSYRVYRTDNAKADNSGDVFWQPISPDLTSGCTSRNTSPTSFACVVTALGLTGGGPFAYAGTGDGRVWVSTDATSASPTWTRLDAFPLPLRPVSSFAVDRSNYRIAFAAYSGFDQATPFTHGHVFMTTDGGQTWTNISSNLPDVPVNTVVLDPSDPNSLYVGTDVGPLATHNLGASWQPMGSGFPIVTVSQLDINSYTRQLRAGSYGRGAWGLDDSSVSKPALQIAVADTGVPVGPGSQLTYKVTLQNDGNITATTVTITNPVPANTTFVSAGNGGTLVGNNVVWHLPSVGLPSLNPTGGFLNSVGRIPGSVSVTFTVHISTGAGLVTGDLITNDGLAAHSAEGVGTTASPQQVVIAAPFAIGVTPASQTDGTRVGQTITYTVAVRNLGYTPDGYNLSISGNAWATSLWNATFTTPITQTANVAAGDTYTVGVKVTVLAAATSGQTDTVTVQATSKATPVVNASATIQTIAVTKFVLLVDENGSDAPIKAIYTAALDAHGFSHDDWDLTAQPVLGVNYMKAHPVIVWYTGVAYPDPLGPYEGKLAAFLDNGGRLFLSGMDILDQSAGTTPFMSTYLHVNWDGSDAQNDVGTVSVTGVTTSPVTSGIGTVGLNFGAIGYVDFADGITPISPAIPAFTLNPGPPNLLPAGTPNALSVTAGNYKVVFLAFPFEAYGNAGARSTLMNRAMIYFGLNRTYLPVISR